MFLNNANFFVEHGQANASSQPGKTGTYDNRIVCHGSNSIDQRKRFWLQDYNLNRREFKVKERKGEN